MIEKVQIIDIDTASENGPRILRIRTRKNIIETPCRMITSTETKFRKDLALSPLDRRFEIETPLFERIYTPKLNYIYLKDNKKEEEIWFHMVDTLRDNPHTSLNYTNLPQIFGIDTVSPRTPYVGGEIKAATPEDTKRFDRLSFDNLSLKEQRDRYDDSLGCTCPICQNRTVSEYIDEYKNCESLKERNPIYKWSRMHEIFATNSEFEIEF